MNLVTITDRLKPYRTYKHLGIDWLEETPEHWDVRRLKFLLKERDTRSVDGSGQLLSVSQYTGVTQRKPMGDGDEIDTRAVSLIGYKRVEPNDLVVNIMLAWNGSMGVSQFPGIASPAYCVYRFGENAHPWYFHYLLRSPIYKGRIKAVSTGVVESRLRLYTDDLYRLEGLLPPILDQSDIVRFLGYIERRIQRYIRAKQKLLQLLAEQKQAIIHRAVTGQIDVRTGKPYPVYKPSGVEWLGDVPEHWEVCKLGQIGRFSKGNGGNKEDEVSAGIPCVRYGDLYTSHRYFIQQSRSYVSEQKAVDYTSIHFGDVLFAGSGETIDEIGTSAVNLILSDTVCGGDVIILRPNRQFDAEFMGYLMDCRPVAIQKSAMGRGITVMHVYSSHLKNVTVAFPPLSEQKAIVPYLGNINNALDSAISNVQQEIELLAEYRTRLVSDVVTGKLDVREAASNLPNEEESMDAMDDAPETKSITDSVSHVAG